MEKSVSFLETATILSDKDLMDQIEESEKNIREGNIEEFNY